MDWRRSCIGRDSEEVQAAAAFMKLTIRQLQRGCYKHLKDVKSGQKQLSTKQLNEAVAVPPVVKAVVCRKLTTGW